MIGQLWQEIITRAERAIDTANDRDRALNRQAARVAGMLDRAFDAADRQADTQLMRAVVSIAERALAANRADDIATLNQIEAQLQEFGA